MSDMQHVYLERLEANDESAFNLGDTIDAKAGLALIVVVFLAEQTGTFLQASDSLTRSGLVAQYVSALALAVAGACCVAAMWPRDFTCEDATKWDEWMQRLRDNHPNDQAAIDRAFFDGRVRLLKQRIGDNRAHCNEKIRFVHVAFWFSVTALALNLGTSVWGWT